MKGGWLYEKVFRILRFAVIFFIKIEKEIVDFEELED